VVRLLKRSGKINNWFYENLAFEPDEEFLKDFVGFVYCITDPDGKKYIGKKFFWSTRRLPPLKGSKRKRKVTKQSDWREYYGSNETLKILVEHQGGEKYEREILRLCKTKGDCSYYEAKLQFQYDVLLRDDYYNAFIGCKIHAKHLTGEPDG
jgi:hypothetical protein|tara:strand:- start:680 stop:1135 length:456 start_codon:yes stop_codon:yes gene_type:complete